MYRATLYRIFAHTRTLIKMDCIRSIIHRANKNPYIYEQHAFWLWISSEQNIRSTLHRSSVSISALVLSAASVYPIWFLAILFLISKFPRSTKYCWKTENKKTQIRSTIITTERECLQDVHKNGGRIFYDHKKNYLEEGNYVWDQIRGYDDLSVYFLELHVK